MKRLVAFDSRQTEVKELEKIEEIKGKLGFQRIEDKLMHSVLENDKETIEKGKIINDAINQGMNSFTPDLLFQQLVKNYSIAKHIYGPSFDGRLARRTSRRTLGPSSWHRATRARPAKGY